MFFKQLMFFMVASLSCTINASPFQKRQAGLDCGASLSCAAYSGTSMWFEPKTGDSCPPITPPVEVALPIETQRSNPASCYYPPGAYLDFCIMGQAELMTSMSSLATRMYNAQPSGAVICGATKTANMPIITPAAVIDVVPVSQMTVTAQPA